MIDITLWTDRYMMALKDAFGDRIWFAGIQGSHGRGEATEDSDIDMVVISCEGSSICFDYPVPEAGAESQRNRELAAAAGEMMKARYSYGEMEALLSY